MYEKRNIGPGVLLASAPMIRDPNFRRTVILLCETGDDGSFGLVLNRPLPFQSEELVEMLHGQSPDLFLGGPVQPDTLHYVHNLPELIEDGTPIADGVFWGGNFETVKAAGDLIDFGDVQMRFFLGYSGWADGQLEAELENNDWLVIPPNHQFVFETDAEKLWSRVVASLGGEYKLFANFPADPRLN